MDDFERRRELRRQKREEMRLEAERLSYQRNDDDDEEAARERRRRARQERLRQKEEGDLSGEVTEKSEVNAQNSVAGEESKRSTDDEAALLERLARREERRQKRLQEALERQKELDPTITDGSLSVPSRREVNNVEENETTGKEEKAETRRGRYEIEETETVTKSYQRNNWRQDGEEEGKKEEKDKEEVQEEKPKELPIEENQVDVAAEKSTDKEEAVTVNAEEHKAENDTNAVPEGTQNATDAVDKEKLRDEEKAEEERKEAEERERLRAEEEKRAAEEKQKAEEEKRAAEEKQKAEEEKRAAEERAKAEEEKRAAEERERAKAEEERRAAEERQKAEEEKRAAEERAKAEEEKRAAEEKAKLEAEKLKEKQKMEEQKIEDKQVKEKKVEDEKPQAAVLKNQEEEKVEAKKEKLPEEKLQATSIKDQVKDDKGKAPKEEMKSVWDRKKGAPEQKAQNGERELPASKLKPTENAFGRSGAKGAAEEAKPGAEALKRLEDQRRRRGESESEELEKLKEKQQEAAAELDELKKRREERRKILEEEEQKKKQEEAERKIREEEEKRRMKEEIERRRAEAAEKRQKMPEDGVSEDKKPFKCLSPKGSSLKIEERTEFLNKSAQKSGMKPTQTTAVVSKIDSRLEQYTSAIEGTKASRPAKASDLHVPAEGVRNIKSMWEKGNVFSSPSGTGTPNKETAGLKVGVSSRINEWLTKTPESNKSPAPKPSDLRPGDVSGKRNLWEKQSVEKPAASSKVSAMGKKSETNAGLRQFEKEP
ncbi:caldesmon isoform X1 [Vidua macroura]|uniref:caldesmon isoform X1 n=1 Tax=Vidua macroura TaxID=187451 RepID=UPI0023A83167|nr:caldesmon isoform X1 [Vidua macroura]XP_053834244.1 caldesmon isoform X1 [Vidua macroura]XP_053834245.1 caldesmon isoform X1 [Vidua macroura]XP_053834246.1 caldesmon isoform X1 [Vidua macroura]